MIDPTKPTPLIPPGAYLSEWMENHPDITCDMAASHLGFPAPAFDVFVRGGVRVDDVLAHRLEELTGWDAQWWMYHQEAFDLRKLREFPGVVGDFMCSVRRVYDTCLAGARGGGKDYLQFLFDILACNDTYLVEGVSTGDGAVITCQQVIPYGDQSGRENPRTPAVMGVVYSHYTPADDVVPERFFYTAVTPYPGGQAHKEKRGMWLSPVFITAPGKMGLV